MKLGEMDISQVITNVFGDMFNKEDDNAEVLLDLLNTQCSNYVKSTHPERLIKRFLITEAQQKGGEGQGEEYYNVFKITQTTGDLETIYIKISGYYSSYEGAYYESFKDCVSLVKPVEKTIIVYQ